jgi:hypothetical protein
MSEVKNIPMSNLGHNGFPEPGSEAEVLIFKKLQQRFPKQ